MTHRVQEVKAKDNLIIEVIFLGGEVKKYDVKNLFNQTKSDLYRFSAFLQRIPGQRMKSAVSKTMPPTMQPSRNVQQQQDI